MQATLSLCHSAGSECTGIVFKAWHSRGICRNSSGITRFSAMILHFSLSSETRMTGLTSQIMLILQGCRDLTNEVAYKRNSSTLRVTDSHEQQLVLHIAAMGFPRKCYLHLAELRIHASYEKRGSVREGYDCRFRQELRPFFHRRMKEMRPGFDGMRDLETSHWVGVRSRLHTRNSVQWCLSRD
jgi:hypothetical protein